MHNIYDSRNQVDRNILSSPDLNGRECCCCFRILDLKHFRKDSSNRDGRAARCVQCESTPWLSIAENTAKLRELNYNSEAHRRRRSEYEESMKCDLGRIGHVMESLEFLNKLKILVPGLIWFEGRTTGDWGVYVQDHNVEFGVRYLWYLPQGILPEYSIHEFDIYDAPVKEKMRGWRTPLLRLIKSEIITEEDAHRVFGAPTVCLSSELYRAELYNFRNRK